MSELNTALVIVGGLVLILGLLSGFIRGSVLSEPLIAVLAGVLIGPRVLGLLDTTTWGSQHAILEQSARLTLAIALMGVALRIPPRDLLRRWRPLAVLLGLVMPAMWLTSGLLVHLILGSPFWVAMLLGAVLTPTDPVVASTIVTGRVAEQNLPDRLRDVLSGESGANDGLAYPLVVLPILLLTRQPQEALTHWFVRTLAWEVGAALAVGALVGYAAGKLLEWSEAKRAIDTTSFLAYTLALSLFVLGGAKLLGTDGVLAVFVAGLAFSLAIRADDRAEEERVQEAVTRFFTLPIFVLLGLAIPWDGWLELGWEGLLLAVAVLVARRLPAVLAVRPLLGSVRGISDTLFLGWFGPIGVAALYYANLSISRAGIHQAWTVASLVVCASIVAHGLTATAFTRLYGRRAGGEA